MAASTRMQVFAAASILAVAGLAIGCSQRPASVKQPIPPPEIRPQAETPAPNFDRKLDPDPNYEPKDIDALARQLSGLSPRPELQYYHTPQPGYRHGAALRHRPALRNETPERRSGLRGDHYLNTLFWGGLGAVIGHQSGHAGRGAIIGAGFGHMVDHGGLHGLLSRDTIVGGGLGAIIGHQSGHAGRGALYGAAAGHLLSDVFSAGR